jgi:hypothetical protein
MTNFKEYFDMLSKRLEPIKQWLGYWLIGESFTDWGAGSSWGAHNWQDKLTAMKVAIYAREIRLREAAILQQWLTPKLPMAEYGIKIKEDWTDSIPSDQYRQDSPKGQNVSDDQIDSILRLIDQIQQERSVPIKDLTPEERLLIESFTESKELWKRTAEQLNLHTQYIFGLDSAEKSSHTPSAKYAPNFYEGIQAQRALEREFVSADDLGSPHDSHTPIGKLTELMVQQLEVDIDIQRDQGVIVSLTLLCLKARGFLVQ